MEEPKKPLMTTEVVEETPEEVVPSDPALDCATCSGAGLVGNARCTNCQGTGKAQNGAQTFPEGTQVLRPDGAYIVTNGVEVKQK